MSRRSDLALVVAVALLAGILIEILPHTSDFARVALGIPLVLLLPGYALSSAIFSPSELRMSEHLALSIALSVTVTILSALLMNAAHIGLQARPWAAILTLLTIAAALAAARRGHLRELRVGRPRLRSSEVAALAVSVLLLTGAAAFGLTPLAAPRGTQGQTALWIVPAPHRSETVCVGVISDQLHTSDYTLALSVRGRALARFGAIRLAPGASWERAIRVGPGRPPVTGVLATTARPRASVATVSLSDWSIPTASC